MGNQLFVIPLHRGSRQKSSRKWVFVSVWGNALLANEGGSRRAGFSFCSTVPALGGPAGTFVIRLGNGNAACCGLTTREPGQFPGSFLAEDGIGLRWLHRPSESCCSQNQVSLSQICEKLYPLEHNVFPTFQRGGFIIPLDEARHVMLRSARRARWYT